MICTSIQNKDLDQIREILQEQEMAEIRLDLCPLDDDDIEALFSESDVPLVATCRIADVNAERKLRVAIEAGAKYVDLEMEAPPWMGRSIRQACHQWGSVLIRSYHDYTGTAPFDSLLSMMEKCRSFGGEIVKIATTARSKADVDAVLQLYREAAPGSLIAFCMGEEGRESRLEALRLGAPFSYACLSDDDATAPGQWTADEMRSRLYGNFRFVRPSAPLEMPASKSFAQRAILAAALADGVSHLSGYTPCGDSESAIALARQLGANVSLDPSPSHFECSREISPRTLTITGSGAKRGGFAPELHVGESGLLARLTIPLAAALSNEPVRITGEKTLLRRPLSDAHDIMASFGVRLYPDNAVAGKSGQWSPEPSLRDPSQTSLGPSLSPRVAMVSGDHCPAMRPGDCTIPLRVAGPLIPGRADVSGKGGSQLISGLLYALPLAEGKSTVYVSEPRSIPYLFITVDVLKKFGIKIASEMEGDEDFLETQDWSRCTGLCFKIKGGQTYTAADFAIEADWSGAAPFLVAGAIFGEVEVEGLDTRSLQADISIMDILIEAGASMSQADDECGSIHVSRAPLNAFDTDLNNCPDLFPIVAVLAAFCPGESHIQGVERLRHKETDRAAAIEQMLQAMGVDVFVDGDCMTVSGIGLTERIASGKMLRGGHFPSHGDHRMVMALRVASLGALEPIDIDDTACVSKSFPTFNELFDQL